MLGVRDIFQLIYNWFIFLFLFFYSVNLYSFKPILITDDFKSISLGNYISLYEDKEGKLDINTIQSPEIKWFSSSKESPSFGFTKSVFWVKYQIQNSSPKKKTLYLEINYPMIDKVEMFAIQSNNTHLYLVGGDSFPFYQRLINYKHIVFPTEISNNSNAIFFLKFTTDSSMNIDLVLHNSLPFVDHVIYEQVAHGFYFGILFIMLFYNLFIYISTRDKSYLYFVLFISFFFMFMFTLRGYSFQYLWTDWIWWANNSLPFFMLTTAMWGMQYSRKFLSTKEKQPIIDKISLVNIVTCMLGTIGCFLLPYSFNIKIAAIGALLVSVVCLIAGLRGFMQKNRIATYYLAAWFFVLIGIVFYVLKTFAILPVNMITTWSIQIGSSLQVLFFSLVWLIK